MIQQQLLMNSLMKHNLKDIFITHRKLINLKDCSANPTEEDKDYIKSNMCRDLLKHFFQSSPIPNIMGGINIKNKTIGPMVRISINEI